MAIVKLSKNGNQIQFIDDFGNVYGTSWQSILNLKGGIVKQGYTMLMRMPFAVSPLRYGVSPVWNPGNVDVMPLQGSITQDSTLKPKDDILAFETYKNRGTGSKELPVKDVGDW